MLSDQLLRLGAVIAVTETELPKGTSTCVIDERDTGGRFVRVVQSSAAVAKQREKLVLVLVVILVLYPGFLMYYISASCYADLCVSHINCP